MKKKKIISIIIFILGLLALIGGIVYLVVTLLSSHTLADGEYLISAKEWVLEDGSNCQEESEANCTPSVIWDFTEIGKGTLTTNNHVNDYDFIWTLEDGKLKIETKWLYELENEYDYNLNQKDGVLILKSDDTEHTFTAQFETE